MNTYTLADKLRTTIAGKEDLLNRARTTQNDIAKHMLREFKATGGYGQESLVDKSLSSVIGYLEVNIDELKRILQDVEQCVGVEE